jgi:RecJ-like exonuclease
MDIQTVFQEKYLIALIFLLTISGLLITYYAISNVDPKEMKISDINESAKGNLVTITGNIKTIKQSKSGNVYLTVDDGTDKITVPLLGALPQKFPDIKKDQLVRITGIVSEYNGQSEVMPKDIEVLE